MGHDLSDRHDQLRSNGGSGLKKLPGGVLDFGELRGSGMYYVDKTMFLPLLEDAHPHLVFTRPRRFGKSLLLSVLEHYYDVRHADQFDSLFDGLAIGESPTRERSSFHVLRFDFSGVELTHDPGSLREAFQGMVYDACIRFMDERGLRDEMAEARMASASGPARAFDSFIQLVASKLDRPLYVLVDEYDHFTHSLLAASYPEFRSAVGRGGFYRTFFEVIKSAAARGVVRRSFITGVTPVTLDSMTSGFNITKDISVYRRFEYLLGFTDAELQGMIAATCDCPDLSVDELMADMAALYDGYKFTPHQKKRVYNPDMTLHYLSSIATECSPPEKVLTSAMATDVGKLRRLALSGNRSGNMKILERLAVNGRLSARIVDSFSLDRDFGVAEFISMLFYMGIVTIEGPAAVGYELAPPNQVVRDIHLRALFELLDDLSSTRRMDEGELDMAVMSLFTERDPQPILLQAQEFLKKLSNRDWIRFDEKYVKLVLMMFFARYEGLIVQSEPEVTGIPDKGSGYLDLFIKRRDPAMGNYDVLFELKYLPKKDATDDAVASALEGAKEQLKAYLESTHLSEPGPAHPAARAEAPESRPPSGEVEEKKVRKVRKVRKEFGKILPVAVVFRHHDLAAWDVVEP